MTDGTRSTNRGNASNDDGAAAGFAPARFRPPVASDDLLERSDLVARLVRGVREHRLTAVVAPAGYGKTTLVGAIARALSGERTVWVSLDESDDEPPLFWAVVGHALSGQVDDIPAPHDLTGVDASDQSQRKARSWQMMRDLLAGIDGGSDTVLVLDDLHHIIEETILEQLRFLVEHAPSNLRVVVASRRMPALPLARLRAQGRFFELSVSELRFTWEETVALFESRGVEVPTGELRRIHERTRGWPAGLQLASSALQLAGSASARTDRARSLARSEQHMRDVLAAEVLASLDDDDREFLLDVALVDRLNPTDARALTGRKDAGSVLDRLYRSGVALLSRTVPSSPGEEPVYQHHPLFSTLLRQRLRTHDRDRYTALHRRAAELEADPARRLAHLVEAGADANVVGELDDHGRTLLARGCAREVLTALESLPDDLVDQHPGLTMLAGRARWQTGDYVDAGVTLRRAATAFGDDAEPGQRSVALVGAADCALLVGNVEQADRDIRNALAGELPPEALASAYAARLRVVQFAGADDIGDAAEDAVRTALEHPEPRVLRDAARSLWMGVGVAPEGLDLLERFCDVAWPVIADEDDFARACLCGLSATVALYRGDPHAAADRASSALELWDRLGVAPPVHAQSARVLLVLASTATGDHAGLDRWLPELRRGAQRIALPPVKISAGLLEARVRWLRDDLAGLRDVTGRLPEVDGLAAALNDIPRAMCALLEGDPDAAIDLLTHVVELEHHIDRRNLFGAPGVLLAGIHAAQGDPQTALEVGLPTLDACSRDRCPGRILIEGPQALPLLRLAVDAGVHVNMARHLIGKLDATLTRPVEVPDANETLTAREVEILRLVSGGATNPQIADHLDISDETVKTHVSRILRKLDVPTRTAAAARARDLGLQPLPDAAHR